MTEKLTDNASLGELMTALESVKNDLQIGKNNVASTLGSPFAGTDKLNVTKTKIETLKNVLVETINSKNVSATSSETFTNLIEKASWIFQSIEFFSLKDKVYTSQLNTPSVAYNEVSSTKGVLRFEGRIAALKRRADYATAKIEILCGGRKESFSVTHTAPGASATVKTFTKDIIVEKGMNIKVQILLTAVGAGNLEGSDAARAEIEVLTILR
ncbi:MULTISPECIES: hypothetical protein [unclassified Clostridioides]|uniref:hypothetical protein n=1 Tax=unclassified Clostridioides TaxID=2635829 RepID=UPI001D11A6F6|nr:hypothetical protein [Clostridioides sp. ES-S-0171-01]MCC0689614.1 hypothetical protein [Clostridioides sp. ES-S-0056-01]MCC0715328.1 hypothetical protein [Clostridioides sp. ES-S-0077-01]